MDSTATTERAYIPLSLTRLGSGSAANGKIARPEYGVTFIMAGYVRRRDGQQSNWKIPAEVLQPAVPMFNGVANFIDHASLATWFYPQIKDMAGVCFAARWSVDLQAINGGIRLSARPDLAWYRSLLDEYLQDVEAGREVPDVGLSAVLYQDSEWVEADDGSGEEIRLTTEIKHVESCDTVFGPGAEGRLREALQSIGQFISIPRETAGKFLTRESAGLVESGGVNPMKKFCPDCGQPWGESHTCPPEPTPLGAAASALGSIEQPQIFAPAPVSAAPLQYDFSGTSNEVLMDMFILTAQTQSPLDREWLNAARQEIAHRQAGRGSFRNESSAILARLDQQSQELTRLTSTLAQREDPNVVTGLGQPPRDPAPGMRISGMLTGLDRFSPAIDWLFGVQGAAYPDPQFRRADQIYQALTGDWNWRGVFDPERVMLAGASTTTLPGLAVNAMNKVVTFQFASLRQYRWYELVTKVTPNDGSTQPMQWIGMGGAGLLPVVPERGAYTEIDVADTKEADDFVKYGGFVGISLEMFRRSEVGKIQAIPVALARDSVMTRSAKIASIFTTASGVGPTLDQDSVALFHASHSNVATTAFGTDSTAWNAVDLEIWNQTEIGSAKPIGVSPKYMLCRRNLYRQALVTFGYGDGQPTTYVPEALDRGPDDPRPFPLAVPDFSDTNDWAAVADPKVYPVVHMSYAQATQGDTHPLPEIFAVVDQNSGLVFTNDTLPVKCRDWFSYGVNGYRGISKRNVA